MKSSVVTVCVFFISSALLLCGCATAVPPLSFDDSINSTGDSGYVADLAALQADSHLSTADVALGTGHLQSFYKAYDNVSVYVGKLQPVNDANDRANNDYAWGNGIVGAVGGGLAAAVKSTFGYITLVWEGVALTYQSAELQPEITKGKNFLIDKATADSKVAAEREAFAVLLNEQTVSNVENDFQAWAKAIQSATDGYRGLLGQSPDPTFQTQ
jgi:hypothetical protein